MDGHLEFRDCLRRVVLLKPQEAQNAMLRWDIERMEHLFYITHCCHSSRRKWTITSSGVFLRLGPVSSSLLRDLPWYSAEESKTTRIWSGFFGWYALKWGRYHIRLGIYCRIFLHQGPALHDPCLASSTWIQCNLSPFVVCVWSGVQAYVCVRERCFCW